VRELLGRKPILGMIHMPALPGAPQSELSMDELVAFALSEARRLEAAGLDACIVENVGDVPLFRDHVPPTTVAAMAVLVTEVRRATSMHVGVNILRNAWEEALSIAGEASLLLKSLGAIEEGEAMVRLVYAEALEAWRTSCPRLTVWEDAADRGYIERQSIEGRGVYLLATRTGEDFLRSHRGPITG